jgi:cation diffusion facilitator CzcD-associated flavoprotein CzcO
MSTIQTTTTHEPLKDVDVIIVGTGFSGLGLGAQLFRRGETSFVMLERADDVGGTWRDNHYPGAACDVPSHLYSLSFRLNPEWSSVYSPQPEILEYLQAVAREEQLLPHIRFGAELLDARWDAETARWTVTTPRGEFTGKSLVAATGHLADPQLPNIKGLDSFTGDVFHSSRWNHDVELENKRIGVLGSGASAIQIVPEMAKVAGQLTVFQRTAPYVVPRRNDQYSEATRGMFRKMPGTMEEVREGIFWTNEAQYPAFRGVPSANETHANVAHAHREAHISDPELSRKLTPDYAIGCKRILVSDDYYPALAQPNVTLETERISHIEGNAVVTSDGVRHELDVLILATGFVTTDLPVSYRVFNEDGTSLADRWSNGVSTHASASVHGFPNFYLINGPFTSMGHNSIVYVIESQINYVLEALEYALDNSVDALEVTLEAEQAYVDKLEGLSQGTVWINGGCENWYTDHRNGRLSATWPDYAHTFRAENGVFDPSVYKVMTKKPLQYAAS